MHYTLSFLKNLKGWHEEVMPPIKFNTLKERKMVLEERIELSWGCPRWILNPVRLPISPLQHNFKNKNHLVRLRAHSYFHHTTADRLLGLPDEAFAKQRRSLVEPRGIEPLTSCMPCKRSPKLSYGPKISPNIPPTSWSVNSS